MQLPEENATAAELKSFVNGLSDSRRLRLAAACLVPSLIELEDSRDDDENGDLDEDLLDEVAGELANGLSEAEANDETFKLLAEAAYRLM